ncbi:hypothetical protein TNCV_2093551 [Trichonephila clavipes]|nr:hypothetical protein TNCV_2093551 [Trichonephila clavipes]
MKKNSRMTSRKQHGRRNMDMRIGSWDVLSLYRAKLCRATTATIGTLHDRFDCHTLELLARKLGERRLMRGHFGGNFKGRY